ncbi:MAG: DUF1289 domain-containing protein [Pseudomonadota bacterium]
MSDDIWRRDEVESPCVKLCMLHPEAQICVGCYRTGAEIAGWSLFTPEERRQIMEGLPARSAQLTSRHGGRAARRRSRRAARSGD